MKEQLSEYHEGLYQWIWETLEFDVQSLKTICGEPISIIEPGERNPGAGPDFLRSKLKIGDLTWSGSVEIHKRAKHWNHHKHQKDPAFNNVVLHVVFDTPQSEIFTEDGSKPFTVNLGPRLSSQLKSLFNRHKSGELPCGRHISFINQDAFRHQILKVHKEYFNYKADALLKYYDPLLPPSKAWKKAFIVQLYRALGIPRNRQAMGQLAQAVYSAKDLPTSSVNVERYVTSLAFDEKNAPQIKWVNTGMRPASRPPVRVKQAAWLHAAAEALPFSTFLKNGVFAWRQLINDLPKGNRPGRSRLSVIKFTVFLPAIYLLGDLFHADGIKQEAFECWQKGSQQVPRKVSDPFKEAGFEVEKGLQVMGLAHQYKRYCRVKRCHKCNVFKYAIRS